MLFSVVFSAALYPLVVLNPITGRGKFTFNKNEVSLGFGGIYDKGDNQIVARYSKTVSPCAAVFD